MKKFLVIVFCSFLLLNQFCFANTKQSNNLFGIKVEEVPSGEGTAPNKKDNGLSDGVIAAIALGSTFGGLGILSGIGYYFYKNCKELQAGSICGQKCPYQTIDNKAFCKLISEKKEYTYLMKASEKSINNENYQYLIIPDTQIKPKTFNTLFFELPKTNNNNLNFRIIQASKPYQIENKKPNLDSNVFLNPKDKNVKKIGAYTKELNDKNGFLIKSGTISNPSSNIANITISNTSKNNSQIYAIIVEFYF